MWKSLCWSSGQVLAFRQGLLHMQEQQYSLQHLVSILTWLQLPCIGRNCAGGEAISPHSAPLEPAELHHWLHCKQHQVQTAPEYYSSYLVAVTNMPQSSRDLEVTYTCQHTHILVYFSPARDNLPCELQLLLSRPLLLLFLSPAGSSCDSWLLQ